MPLSDAVNKPKFHHQWLPDIISIEKGFDPKTAEQLKLMGYKLEELSQIGRVEAIRATYTKKGASFTAVGDHRGDDDARGY
jgi:gamma-glutamyltranspeptidase/glutathione hydrolase